MEVLTTLGCIALYAFVSGITFIVILKDIPDADTTHVAIMSMFWWFFLPLHLGIKLAVYIVVRKQSK